jgi:hypothetical protein
MQDLIESFIEECKTAYNKNFNSFKSLCESYDLAFYYDKNSKDSIVRIIFRIKKNNKSHKPIYYLCNGLVIDVEKWKQCNVPPIAFNKNLQSIDIKKYNIYKIIDGTVVTFYYWKSKWNISTNNSYDVSSYYWMGNKTYAQIINDLMTRLYPEAVKSNGFELIDSETITFKKLNKEFSYTIGFRHHDFHPLLKDPECIWNIHHSNMDIIYYKDGLTNIPNQVPISSSYTLEELQSFIKTSITDAMKPEPVINYGYILKSKCIEETMEKSNILIPSPLLQKIKTYIYEKPMGELHSNINHNNRFNYIVLKNYAKNIISSDHNDLSKLYPQIQNKYDTIQKFINETIECIISLKKSKDYTNKNTSIIILANSLINDISKYEIIDYNDHVKCKSILKDYILNQQYYIWILQTLNNYS